MRCPSLAGFKIQLHRLYFAVVFAFSLMTSAPVQATRGIVIDVNSFEVYGDANNGDVIPLSFPINYGAGLQSKVTVNLPEGFSGIGGTAEVGLTFTNSPSDSLFATILGGSIFYEQVPAVSISNANQVSTPENTVSNASIFDFGTIVDADMPPSPCPPSEFCYVYGPLATGANFQFVNLSSSGTLGDFELNITCAAAFPCENVGFSLAGENFSSATFDPAKPPTNLVDYSTDVYGGHSWSFIFRNAPAVPEPSTWAMMLVGFGAIGLTMTRKGRPGLAIT